MEEKQTSTTLWRSFTSYLQDQYGERVWKIPVDAGFTCPNRDGSCGVGGCTYCNNRAFSPPSRHRGAGGSLPPIRTQVEEGIERARKRKARKFMVYFQAYSNTYAPPARLKELYDEALRHPAVVALAVGTRPDCIDTAVTDLLASYSPRYEVWLELGLQTFHDETLRRINRGHTVRQSLQAFELLRERPIKVCVHTILGLPGETRDHNRQTADALARLPYHGLKIHPLQILAETVLAEQYARGEVTLLNMEEFVVRAADFLERTPAHVVIQRLTADALSSTLLAPAWCREKQRLLDGIAHELRRRGTRQGARVHDGRGLAAVPEE